MGGSANFQIFFPEDVLRVSEKYSNLPSVTA